MGVFVGADGNLPTVWCEYNIAGRGGCCWLVGADLVSARPATESVIFVGTTALGRPFV